MKKVLILFGGPSTEHLVSCRSTKGILENIDYKKFDVTTCGISKNNIWYVFNDSLELLENGNWLASHNNEYVDNIAKFINEFDVVFPVIHGALGEDGKLQAMFDMFDVKYVGSGSLANAICMDKHFTKLICDSYNIKQVDYIVIKNRSKKCIKECIDKIGFPAIVKPCNGGSSIGISIAHNKKELDSAIKLALSYDKKVIVEKFIKCREFECGILFDKKIIASSVGEVLPSNEFYDYDAKYDKKSEVVIPAGINDELNDKIKELSIKIFEILECSGFARVDFLYDEDNDILYFNEINTIPGFTKISMYSKLFEYDGISYRNLITKLIENC